MHRRMIFLFLSFGLVSFVAISGVSAAVKPVRWLPSQAGAKATVAFGVKVQEGGRYTAAVCKGIGKPLAGRFASFKCSYTYRPGAFGTPVETTNVWLKVRPVGAGGACVSWTAVVPAACLRASAAAGGSPVDATNLYLAKVGASAQPIKCVGADGWYGCTDGGTSFAGTVVYTRKGVKVTVL